jgi:hypothetical protein
MSLLDDKKNVFTKIGAYTSMVQNVNRTKDTNLFPSINNKEDIVPFLLDTLKVIVGTEALKKLTGELFTKLVDNAETKMKDALKKQVTQFNSGDGLPTTFTTTGYQIPVKDIDVYGKFKTSPDSKVGNLLYDQVKPNFDNLLYNAIKNESTTSIGGLNMTYSPYTDEITFKGNPAASIGAWTNNYIDSLTLLDKKEFMTNVMNKLYGSVTSNQNKTVNETYQELVVDKLIEQVIDDNNDTFELLPNDYDELMAKANEMVNGVLNYNMGCGLYAASLNIDSLSTISNISGSTDEFYVSNQIDNTIDESISNQDVASENSQSIKDGFFQRLIRYIALEMSKALATTPQIRTILGITSAFQNGVVQLGNPIDDLKKFKIFIACNIKEILKMINEYIFNTVKKYLVLLLKPIIREILNEKINQFKKILKSLLPQKITSAISTG